MINHKQFSDNALTEILLNDINRFWILIYLIEVVVKCNLILLLIAQFKN